MALNEVRLSVVLLAALAATGCGSLDSCENRIITSVPSPGGTRQAVVFERGCGATTETSTQVSVLGPQEHLLEVPTAWSRTEPANAAVFKPERGAPAPSVEIVWTGPSTLRIEYGYEAKLMSPRRTVDDISVLYERKSH